MQYLEYPAAIWYSAGTTASTTITGEWRVVPTWTANSTSSARIKYTTSTTWCDCDTTTGSYTWNWADPRITWNVTYSDGYCEGQVKVDPKDRLRKLLRDRQFPLIGVSRKSLEPTEDVKETRARETLRRVIGDAKFREFVKKGFLSVRGRSGLIYQIFPSSHFTNVYKNGQMVERLCVILRGNFPPTDSLIMRYLLILNDENDFRNHAIKHPVYEKTRATATPDLRPLPEIYRELTGKRGVA